MKFYISYFYQVRNMKSNMLPVSTAMWNPKWFDPQNGKMFMDKNGVINGCNFRSLVMPYYKFQTLTVQHQECQPNCPYVKDAPYCPYMNLYREYIKSANSEFEKFIRFAESYVRYLNSVTGSNIDTVIFLVHEKPSISCGERQVLQEWFHNNGIELLEWEVESDGSIQQA